MVKKYSIGYFKNDDRERFVFIAVEINLSEEDINKFKQAYKESLELGNRVTAWRKKIADAISQEEYDIFNTKQSGFKYYTLENFYRTFCSWASEDWIAIQYEQLK